jgi:hypothetical protein
VDLADLVDLLRVEEDPLGHGRLARVDMRDDADVRRASSAASDLAIVFSPRAGVAHEPAHGERVRRSGRTSTGTW